MDEKLKKIIFISLGCFIILFLFLFIMSSCSKKISPKKLELELIENAKYYYDIHKEELPSKNSETTLSLNDLVNKGIIKELDKLLDKDTTCSGTLTIENNNDYYMYSPSLNCTSKTETYSAKNLKDLLLESVVTSGNGLHKVDNSYYFRGDKIDNYLIFDGILWRITKINNDNSIRLIEDGTRPPIVWDDRYNETTYSTTGINEFYYNNLNSSILEYLNELYEKETLLSNNAKGYIKETSLCIGKRNLEETINNGSIECSNRLDNQYLGLLQLNEYFLASLDTNCVSVNSKSCRNYNYLAELNTSYWTLTANQENNNKVYKINTTVTETSASNVGMARLVINISENTTITGTGTEEDPYVVTGFSNELKELN